MRPRLYVLLAASVTLLASAPAPAQLLASNLLYYSVQPCRVIDTRVAQGGSGTLAGGSTTLFNIVGTSLNTPTPQGGHAGGCAVPPFHLTTPQVQAVALNFVAVNPTGKGNLKAWPSDQAEPLASV